MHHITEKCGAGKSLTESMFLAVAPYVAIFFKSYAGKNIGYNENADITGIM